MAYGFDDNKNKVEVLEKNDLIVLRGASKDVMPNTVTEWTFSVNSLADCIPLNVSSAYMDDYGWVEWTANQIQNAQNTVLPTLKIEPSTNTVTVYAYNDSSTKVKSMKCSAVLLRSPEPF